MTVRYLDTREVQLEELKILTVFDSVCQELGLRYSLDAGTLLGAVRHKGFIPWDDDVDVCMPRPDYERFLRCADKLPDGFSVITMDNSSWGQPFAKVQWHAFRAQEPGLEGVMDEYLWVDIFPFDGMPATEADHNEVVKRLSRYGKKLAWSVYRAPENAPFSHKAFKWLFRLLFGSPRQVLKTKQKINATFGELDYENADRAFCYCSATQNGSYLTTLFDDPVLLPFEGRSFPCVSNWDEYLTSQYGNYMELPPEDQRKTHGLKVWAATKVD